MIIRNRKLICKYNGQKGGRPKNDSGIRIEIPDINLVILTPTQYGSLLEKYGYELLRRALFVLEEWLNRGGKYSEKYLGKNHYAYFRKDGWVINAAKMDCGRDG